jgi:hypothetical protein
MSDSESRAFATRVVPPPQARVPLEPVSTPIYQTSTYRADTPGVLAELAGAVQPSTFYSRYGNPTVEVWERTIADLEGGKHGLALLVAVRNWTSVAANDRPPERRKQRRGAGSLLVGLGSDEIAAGLSSFGLRSRPHLGCHIAIPLRKERWFSFGRHTGSMAGRR